MPKPRKAIEHCSFCGSHQSEVAFCIKNPVGDAACCTTCALAIVEQAFQHMHVIERGIRKMQQDPSKIIVPGDTTDDAIRKTIG
jgi:hypothetical protein